MRDADPAAALGMNYTSLVPVLVKAIKEQQMQIEQQQAQIKTQGAAVQHQQQQIKRHQLVISSLMKLACADHPQANIRKVRRQ